MNNYHFNLNLPVPFIPYEVAPSPFKEVPMDINLVNKEFVEWLESIGLTFYMGRFFKSPPFVNYALHIDGKAAKDCVKINLVFDSSDTIMNWYEPLPGYNGTIKPNPLGESVVYYEKERCKILHSAQVNSHCVINGNVVHDLKNGLNHGQTRKCYSIFLIDAKTSDRLKWDNAMKIFKPYMV